VLAAGLGRAVGGGASVIAAAGGATVSGMAGGGPATSRGACGARRPLTLERLSRLEIESLRDCFRIKLSLGGSDVVLVSFKATVLAKISDHPAPTEGATWAVSDDLFDLVEGLGCAGSFLGTS